MSLGSFGQVVEEIIFKKFLFLALVVILFSAAPMLCAILVEGIKGNISVKL